MRAASAATTTALALGPRASEPQKKGARAKKPEEIEYWSGDLASAQASAKERGVGLMIVAVLHDEEASDRFAEQLLDNRTLAEATEKVIVVLVNNGTHELVEKTFEEGDEKVTRRVCGRFHTRSCTEHQRSWDAVYREYVLAFDPEADWKLPEVILVAPDAKISSRLGQGESPSDADIVRAIEKVQSQFGMGLTVEELRAVKAALEAGRTQGRQEAWAAAYAEWQKVLALAPAGAFGEEAAREQAIALGKMQADLDAARAQLTPEGARAGITRLLELQQSFEGTPLEKEVNQTLKTIEKDKQLKAVLEELRTEAKADEIWAEAQALLQAGDRKKALRVAKKLLGRKYANTPAARSARAALPELDE